MIEGVHYFGEQLRWNLGFPQPNAGGAFAAMVISVVWAVALLPAPRKTTLFQFLCFVLGGIGSHCLVMTFSRGGLVALIVSLAGCGALVVLKDKTQWKPVLLKLASMLALLAILTQVSGLDERMAPTEITTGNSTTARLELWTAGLQMIHLKPISGWGIGESGSIYMNWFQRLDGTHRVAGMINSYLHIATERGLPFLALVLFPFISLTSISVQGFRKSEKSKLPAAIYLSSLSVLLSFATVNFFSTLWVFKHLWWLPTIATLAILIHQSTACNTSSMLCSVKHAILGALVLPAVIYITSIIAGLSSPMSRLEDGYFVFESSGDRRETILVFGDESVLGHDFGKHVRQLAVNGMNVLAPESKNERTLPYQPFDKMICCGGHNLNLNSKTTSQTELIILNPLFNPPEQIQAESVKIILGSLRPKTKQMPWLRASESDTWQLEIINGTGQDLRSNWPDVLQMNLQVGR